MPLSYKSSLAGFLVFLGLTLSAIVDFRRGFLFMDYVRTPYSAYHPAQFVMVAFGAAGMIACYRLLKYFEARLTISVTYAVVRFSERWNRTPSVTPRTPAWLFRSMNLYLRMFDVDSLISNRKMDTPAALVRVWCYASLRLGLVLVPTLLVWSIVTAAIVQVLPSAFGNNLPSVVIAAVTGTLLMISTWTEIPLALQLIQSGFTGPAATLLVVLPPISLPCAMLLYGSLGQFRTVALLGLAVMAFGIGVGVIFL